MDEDALLLLFVLPFKAINPLKLLTIPLAPVSIIRVFPTDNAA